MPLTNYEANKYIKDRLTTGKFVGLLKNDPGVAGDTASEVSATEYKRQSIIFIPGIEGRTHNKDEISFPIASSNWGTIKFIGIFDAATGGNLISYSKLNYEREIRSADRYIIPEGYNIFEVR
ncbi:MAG: phage tail fiber protein [Cetobacterium sp.]|uniref:phage tail fiber protein n=1 Tax=Cetobacterium sp. TaxID=2071632 RepID=UPI003F2EFFEB